MSTLHSALNSELKEPIHSAFGEEEHAVVIDNLLLEDNYNFLLEDGIGLILLE